MGGSSASWGASLGLVLARRLRWKPVGADEGRSVVVDGEGRGGDLWAGRWHPRWRRRATGKGGEAERAEGSAAERGNGGLWGEGPSDFQTKIETRPREGWWRSGSVPVQGKKRGLVAMWSGVLEVVVALVLCLGKKGVNGCRMDGGRLLAVLVEKNQNRVRAAVWKKNRFRFRVSVFFFGFFDSLTFVKLTPSIVWCGN